MKYEPNWEEALNKSDQAVECFNAKFSCSQAVFSVYAVELGMDIETALKVAGAFGGGIARSGEFCGAVTGALMAIGLKYGKTKAEDEVAKEKTYLFSQEFIEEFKSRNGTVICKELTGCDMSSPEGLQKFKDNNIHVTRCAGFVRDAAEMLAKFV